MASRTGGAKSGGGGGSVASSESMLRFLILCAICLLAVSVRLFAVVRYESVIHEFDPHFNFRTTKELAKNGFYEFHNWFDAKVWYPLGRRVGTTVYPGLMLTAGFFHWVLNSILGFPVVVRNVCVFLAPVFAALTSMVAYWMGSEVQDRGSGLVAAALVALVPGYISRSVAGSYDNEAVAIFALMITFALWIKAVKTGSLLWSALCSVAYFYMVASWGGYVFIINLIPLYTVVMLLAGRFSQRLYVAYSTFYVLGTLMSMQCNQILFLPAETSEHMAALGTFGLIQLVVFTGWVRSHLTAEQFKKLLIATAIVGAAVLVGVLFLASILMTGFTGRFFSLLDPTGKHIAIIKSVSEHQPPVWTTFFMDLHIGMVMMPLGVILCFRRLSDASLFLIMYGVTASYFASVMVRLVLVLAPASSVLSGIAISYLLDTYLEPYRLRSSSSSASSSSSSASAAGRGARAASPTVVDSDDEGSSKSRKGGKKKGKGGEKKGGKGGSGVTADTALPVLVVLIALLIFYVIHCSWVAAEAYSSPSVVLASQQRDGTRVLFDDFREAYFWLQTNTAEDARIMSWWDYGYQLASMADRTTLVDNNTWNNTHIATVGRMMASSEEDALPLLKKHDVDYILVVFGGVVGYSSDDINKFLWMVRIAAGVFPDIIREGDYMSPANGYYAVDHNVSPTMEKSLMYKMCYSGFGSVNTGSGDGFDRARNVMVSKAKDIKLKHISEAFTSEHWMVRIYKVNKEPNRPK